MASYFISIKKFVPIGSNPLFVGPFKKDEDARQEIQRGINEANFEILTDETPPKDATRAILVEVVTQTAAKRSGLDKKNALIGDAIPVKAEEVGLTPLNGNNQKTMVTPQPVKEKEETIVEIKESDQYNRKPNQISSEDLVKYEISDAIIVTKHLSNVEWLRQQGVHGEVMTKVYPNQIDGKRVVGTLPYRLGVLAKSVGVIDLPKITADQSGKALTTEDLYNADARLRWFRVLEEKDEWKKIFRYIDKPGNMKKLLKFIEEE